MRYELSCNVESQTFLDDGTHSFERSGKIYTFRASEDKRLREIAISAKVANVERFKMKFVSKGFLEEYDGELRDEIVRDFQYLEAVLGFAGEVARIYWAAPRSRVVSETEEEALDIISASLHFERKWAIVPNHLLSGDLEAMIDHRQIIQPVQLLQTFFREGKNELYQFRFINAFYSLFFVLEGLYGDGKSGTKQLEAAFWSHPEFRDVATTSWRAFVEQDMELSEKVLSEVGSRDDTEDQLISKVIDWVINTRGATHHFYLRSSRKQGTPLNQGDYEPVACFTFLFAERAINSEVNRLHAANDPRLRSPTQ